METLYFKCSFCGFRISYVIGHLKIKFLRIGQAIMLMKLVQRQYLLCQKSSLFQSIRTFGYNQQHYLDQVFLIDTYFVKDYYTVAMFQRLFVSFYFNRVNDARQREMAIKQTFTSFILYFKALAGVNSQNWIAEKQNR